MRDAFPEFPLPDRIRRARQLAGMDQHALAATIGTARNTVSNYETGKSEPTATNFVRIARATGVSLDWLANGVVVMVDATEPAPAPEWHPFELAAS